MDGFPRPSQQNHPIPPISPLPHQSSPLYRSPPVSSPQQLQTPNGEAIPTPPASSQTSSPYYVPNMFPRNLIAPTRQPNTLPYPHFNYPLAYGGNSFSSPPVQSSVTEPQPTIERNRELPMPHRIQVPEWQPDNLVRSCPICNNLFTFFNRRHHCRKCGRVVCAQCSSFKILLPSSAVVRNPAEVPLSTPANQTIDNFAYGLFNGNERNPGLPTDPSENITSTNQANYRHSWTSGLIPDVVGVGAGVEEVRACGNCKTAVEQDFLNSDTAGIYAQRSDPAMLTIGRTAIGPNAWASPSANVDISGTGDGNSRRRRQSIQGGRSLPYTYNPEMSSHSHLTTSVGQPNLPVFPMNMGMNINTSTISSQGLAHPLGQYPYQQVNFPGVSGLGTPGAIRGPHFPTTASTMPLSVPQGISPVPALNIYQQNLRRVEQPARPHAKYLMPQQSALLQARPYAPSAPAPPAPFVPSAPSTSSTPSVLSRASPNNLKETDFCPICTHRLPPPHPETGDETEREEHIQECIRAFESSTSPQRDQSRQGDGAIPSGNPSADNASPDTTGSLRLGSIRGGSRMVVYQATEIDTWDFSGDDDDDGPASSGSIQVGEAAKDDGADSPCGKEAEQRINTSGGGIGYLTPTNKILKKEKIRKKAECVICFEEFEIGQAIARLECLCRYHKTCIRAWFDRKGNSDCPVHAVRE